MIQTGAILAETRAAQRPKTQAAGPSMPNEPATARALWPTFMRRTLDEEVLRPAAKPAAGTPAEPVPDHVPAE